MTALTLSLRTAPPERLDLSALVPERLADLSLAAIEKLAIGTTRRGVRVADLFAVTGDDVATIVVEGGSERLDNVGAGMKAGSIRVEGPVGAYLGRGLKGGTIVVTGAAGPYAATAMTDGVVEIGGDAGAMAGGATHGAMAGMAGGLLVIRGRAGERLGDRMKRGIIVALGGTGPTPGGRMAGGTIVTSVLGDDAGLLMKRGTLIATRAGRLLPTHIDSGCYQLPFLALFRRWLDVRVPEAAALVPTRARRYRGDMAGIGKGEIFLSVEM